jgi:Domain of unknown function (DUF4114)/VPDSG-CTERM motif
VAQPLLYYELNQFGTGVAIQTRNKIFRKNMKKLCILSAAALCLSASSAMATQTPVLTSGEPSLASILDTAYGMGNYTRIDDGVDNIWWQVIGGPATVKAKYAGNGNDLWTATTPAGLLDNFVVAGNVGSLGTIAPTSNPFLFADVTSGGSSIGGNYFVSDSSLNVSGQDHMVTFQINKDTAGNALIDTYVIAWEDLQYAVSDKDFNDLVVEVSGVTPVPDSGTTMILLGSALCGIGALRRRLNR